MHACDNSSGGALAGGNCAEARALRWEFTILGHSQGGKARKRGENRHQNGTRATEYRYNAELRRMVKDLKLTHIVFVRVQELPSNNHATGDIVDMNEDDYLVRSPKTREEFLATDIGNWDIEEQLKTDEGILRTYRGYLCFLKLDLEEPQISLPRMRWRASASKDYLVRRRKKSLAVLPKK